MAYLRTKRSYGSPSLLPFTRHRISRTTTTRTVPTRPTPLRNRTRPPTTNVPSSRVRVRPKNPRARGPGVTLVVRHDEGRIGRSRNCQENNGTVTVHVPSLPSPDDVSFVIFVRRVDWTERPGSRAFIGHPSEALKPESLSRNH